MTLDSLRQRLPEFGFAVYAFDPTGPVTVEVHAPDGSVFTRTGDTEDEAWAGLFPPAPPQVKQTQLPEEATDESDAGSIFD